MDGQTDGRTDGQGDSYIPPKLCLWGVYNKKIIGHIEFSICIKNKTVNQHHQMNISVKIGFLMQ
jgi:hypothetical protein